MKLGITGTRHGMTAKQKVTFMLLINRLLPTIFRHGSCRGVDVQAAEIVRAIMGEHDCLIIAHPGPDGDEWRADSEVDNKSLPGKTHFARNRDIVNNVELLIAFPPCKPMPERGGTAYTYGYARKYAVPTIVIWPDGTTTEEGNG